MKQRFLCSLIALTIAVAGYASTREITLAEAVAMARRQSVDAAVALNELRAAYWEYRTFKADLLPEISFSATAPSYNTRYSAYQKDDGSYTFLRDDNLMVNGALTLEQRIWLTGGTISLTSSLDFMRQLSGDVGNRFMSVPVALKLNQPIFGVNDVKWKRKIEPYKYRAAKAAYISATEEVAMTAIQYFFNLLSARENESSALQNVENARRLYDVAKAKREMGKISENDLLQIELNLLNSQSTLTDYQSTVKSCMFRLRSFLDIDADVELIPVVPEKSRDVEVAFDNAFGHAIENNTFYLDIMRRYHESEYAVAQAKAKQREINLFAQVGYTGVADRAGYAYRGLKDNRIVEVGISIPLVDWGKRRGQVKVAQSNHQLTVNRIKKEREDFRQDLFVLVERFNNQQQQLALASRADEIAVRRYDSSVETFMVGKISALDLNDAQDNKDTARAKYFNELFYYWYYYYKLRSITLWDYETDSPIEADFENILKN